MVTSSKFKWRTLFIFPLPKWIFPQAKKNLSSNELIRKTFKSCLGFFLFFWKIYINFFGINMAAGRVSTAPLTIILFLILATSKYRFFYGKYHNTLVNQQRQASTNMDSHILSSLIVGKRNFPNVNKLMYASLILLLAGDIETCPGPLTNTWKNSDFTILH